jgi:hypothetical protein
VSNDGEILNIAECLTMLLYHSLNQKATTDSAPELFSFGACTARTAITTVAPLFAV